MKCVFPVINSSIKNGSLTLQKIADTLEEDVAEVNEKLAGIGEFDINEAMTINNELFPDTPFKQLFSKSEV